MSDSTFIAMYICINIFLVAIWWGVLDIRDRVKRVEKRMEEKEET